ncbi:MAG TPA: cytochrome c3 family protein [Longimicrobiales bacterium]
MAPPFPPWSDSLLRAGLVLMGIVVLGVPLLLMAWVRSPQIAGQRDPIAQPVAFDHRHHVADDGIDCRYCHDLVDRSPYAGVPPTERCLNCHSQIWSTSPELARVWTSYVTDTPVPWRRVHQLPDFVYFDHAVHVGKGIGCETCHGRVDRMARVYQVAPLTMGWCLDCHRHPERHLRPLAEVTTMGWRPARPQSELGAELARRYEVRSITNCTACHR